LAGHGTAVDAAGLSPKMTDIDPRADIEIHPAGAGVTVRIPLAGPVAGGWLQCYQQLALARGMSVEGQAHDDRASVVVHVPASSDPAEVAAMLDAARALIADADAQWPPAAATAEASARDWWAARRDSASRGPGSGTNAASARAEKRWPMAFTLLLAIAVPLVLPPRFSFGPPWAVPVAEGVLLVAIVAFDRGRIDRRSAAGRALALTLMAVLVAGAAVAASRLVVDLVEGGPETNSAADLLKTGFLVWAYTIIAFTFLYWLLDGGGPESRFLAPREFPQLAFPPQLNPGVAPRGWRPEFFDYLYLGFTDATAFSPTDVMPLARWAKLAMTVQAVSSLMILGLVIARAVNILK
jgi:uncharacterized membrane protein